MTGFPEPEWREVLLERVDEAVETVLRIAGVIDVVVGGSVGRGEPWPFSDIDLIPIAADGNADLQPAFAQLKVDCNARWASAGWAPTVDIGWLTFSAAEVASAVDAGMVAIADRMRDPRWLHGLDKAAGGHGAVSNGPGTALAQAAAATRFDHAVRRARFDSWLSIVNRRLTRARELLDRRDTDEAFAAAQVAGPLAAATLETWGEREGSMTKFPTHFERIAADRGESVLAASIGSIARSSVDVVTTSITNLPAWLETRIELAYRGRRAVGEDVSAQQNQRDHILLFLGSPGLPTLGEWLRQGFVDQRAYVDATSDIVASVQRLVT